MAPKDIWTEGRWGRRPRVCVALATRGRASLTRPMVAALRRQSMPPDLIVISCVRRSEDVGECEGDDVLVLEGAPGLTVQRNAALEYVAPRFDIVVFLDDDFVPRIDWIEKTAQTFAKHRDIAGLTGRVVRDGINGPGLTWAEAEATLSTATEALDDRLDEAVSPYGCNMAFALDRMSDLRFDERLILYGWQEDRDFGARVARRGRTIRLGSAVGVHLGVRSGRMREARLGYSQMVNPIYLLGKGTMSRSSCAAHILGNLYKNIVRSLAPEMHIDRRGRLWGNVVGIAHIVANRAAPERAAEI